jgi:ATP-binding cassette subfamily B protein
VKELAAAGKEVVRLACAAAPALLIGYVAVTLVEAVAPVAMAWLTKLVLDRLVVPGPIGPLAALAVGLAVIGLSAAALPMIGRYLRTELGRRGGVVATDRLFAATERFVGLRRFEDPRFLDRLRLAQQSTGAISDMVDGVCGTARGALMAAGFVGSLAVLNPMMTGLVLAAAIPALVAELLLSRRRATMLWETEQTHRREFFYSRLLTGLEAAKEIRLFGIGGYLRGKMMVERRQVNVAGRQVDRRELMTQGALAVLAAVMAGGGLIWATLAARRGQLSVGDVSMFVASVGGVQSALALLVSSIAIGHQNLLLFTHYVAVVRQPCDLPVKTAPLPELRNGIEFRDVWFRYGDDLPWVLCGVNLTIPFGKSIALVGLNGAGKSTVAKLICRFYDPTRGAILWDGTDMRDVDPAELRNRMSVVFQDHMNYDLTAAENIALGDLEALDDDERIRAAADNAGIAGTLDALPRGYDTLLTRTFFTDLDTGDAETGMVLSGGQWQRLALARAFVRGRRDLMILDEPSSGLDPEAEQEVHVKIRHHRADRTSLLISHRLSAVRDADLIAVLHDGQVAELGAHDTLMEEGGRYARLFHLQAAGYAREGAAS